MSAVMTLDIEAMRRATPPLFLLWCACGAKRSFTGNPTYAAHPVPPFRGVPWTRSRSMAFSEREWFLRVERGRCAR